MQAGTRIGHYEIVAALGRGGMGEVWRARDTRLKREVAIKALPPELARDPDRLARLEREATLLAAVNHPNIAVIHGLEEQDGARFLVLELVEGSTLADRLRGRPFALRESLEIALQIATALEAAHEKGVIHRDLKPANIKVTPEGRVKVLDFGLAKTLVPAAGAAETQIALRTELGVVTGTAPYMSPEQARGEAVGRQSDIWSFGVVLYEMLSGVSPFERDTGTETLARVLEAQPDYAALPPATPASVQRLIRRCLEKDLRRRFRDMGDVRIEVEDALAAEPAANSALDQGRRRNGLRRAAVGLSLVGLIALAGLGVGSIVNFGAPTGAAEVVRLSIAGLEQRGFSPIGAEHLALSPDGSRFAYAGLTKVFIRRMGVEEAFSIDGSAVLANPFFSPDGDWLGFFDGGFWKMPSAGGAPVLVAETTERPAGATWGADGTIVFATTAGLYAVAANGGAPRLLIRPDPTRGERQYAWPHFLPDGRAVLFTIVPQGSLDMAQIALLDLETLEQRALLTGGTSARYVPTGHLVYAAARTLMAVAFDADSRETRGAPVTLRGIAVAMAPDNGAAEFAVSATGTLAFIAPAAPGPPPARTLAWLDREGNEEPLSLAPGQYAYARVSPDGNRIALDIGGVNRDIWIWDRSRESLTRLTDGPNEDMLPLWAPDGRRVFFASNRTGNFDIYSQPADGSTPARLELADPKFQGPNSFSPDGTQLVVNEDFRDLSIVDLTGPSLRPLLNRESIDYLGEVSPDGHWLAYESDESGAQFEIYVRPFPAVEGQREKVSNDGGRHAKWGPPGSGELYYVDLDGAMMAVPMELSPTLRVGRPTKLFDFMPPGRGGVSGRTYDVSPVDGRFLRIQNSAPTAAESIDVSVVLNWFEELRAQAPPN